MGWWISRSCQKKACRSKKSSSHCTGWAVRHCHQLLLCPSHFFSFVWCTALSIVLKMHWYAWSIEGGMQHWSNLSTGNDTSISYKSNTHRGYSHVLKSFAMLQQFSCWDIPISASKIGMEFIPSAGFPFMVAVCIKKSNSYQAAGWKWQLKGILSNNQMTKDNKWLIFWTVCSNFTLHICVWTVLLD